MDNPACAWMRKRRLKRPDKTAADSRRPTVTTTTARGLRRPARRRSRDAAASARATRRLSRGEQPRVPGHPLRLRAARRGLRPGQHPPGTPGDPARARRLNARVLIQTANSPIGVAPLVSAVGHPRRRSRRATRDRRLPVRMPAAPRRDRVVTRRPRPRSSTPRARPAERRGRCSPTRTSRGSPSTPRRLRHRLDRRRAHDLPAVPCRLAGHGRASRAPQGRDDRAREGLRPRRALQLIAEHGVTMLSGVPTTYQLHGRPSRLGRHRPVDPRASSPAAARPCPTRILNAYEERGLRFSQGYGMTETSPGATSLSPAMTREKQGSVGLPHFFTDVRIADDDGAVVPRPAPSARSRSPGRTSSPAT